MTSRTIVSAQAGQATAATSPVPPQINGEFSSNSSDYTLAVDPVTGDTAYASANTEATVSPVPVVESEVEMTKVEFKADSWAVGKLELSGVGGAVNPSLVSVNQSDTGEWLLQLGRVPTRSSFEGTLYGRYDIFILNEAPNRIAAESIVEFRGPGMGMYCAVPSRITVDMDGATYEVYVGDGSEEPVYDVRYVEGQRHAYDSYLGIEYHFPLGDFKAQCAASCLVAGNATPPNGDWISGRAKVTLQAFCVSHLVQ